MNLPPSVKIVKHLMLCLVFCGALLLWTMDSPAIAATCSPGTITVTAEDGYKSPPLSDLQAALDIANSYDSNYQVKITLSQGCYASGAATIVYQIDKEACKLRQYKTGFLLRRNGSNQVKTTIEGATGKPEDVIIWGKVPQAVINEAKTTKTNYLEGFSALTLVNNNGNRVEKNSVLIKDVTIVSDGGLVKNGIGDATLNVLNTVGKIKNSIITANKTSGNRLLAGVSNIGNKIDQEGIVFDGKKTDFTVEDSVIGGNFHNGIMAVNGAKVTISSSLIKGNGFGVYHPSVPYPIPTDFEVNSKGQGITSFSDYCYNSYDSNNTSIQVNNSQIYRNTSNGILIRGDFRNSNAQNFSNNDIAENGRWGNKAPKHGFQIGGWQDITHLNDSSSIAIANNDFFNNGNGNEFDRVNVDEQYGVDCEGGGDCEPDYIQIGFNSDDNPFVENPALQSMWNKISQVIFVKIEQRPSP